MIGVQVLPTLTSQQIQILLNRPPSVRWNFVDEKIVRSPYFTIFTVVKRNPSIPSPPFVRNPFDLFKSSLVRRI